MKCGDLVSTGNRNIIRHQSPAQRSSSEDSPGHALLRNYDCSPSSHIILSPFLHFCEVREFRIFTPDCPSCGFQDLSWQACSITGHLAVAARHRRCALFKKDCRASQIVIARGSTSKRRSHAIIKSAPGGGCARSPPDHGLGI